MNGKTWLSVSLLSTNYLSSSAACRAARTVERLYESRVDEWVGCAAAVVFTSVPRLCWPRIAGSGWRAKLQRHSCLTAVDTALGLPLFQTRR